MKKDLLSPAMETSPSVWAGRSPAWLLALVALLLWQTWMTLGLFDPGRSIRRILDDRPILSGRHPLHLYHGFLGARSLFERGSLSCYDPSFYAGYPKTPVFDPGSRPAELALALAQARTYLGGDSSPFYQPAAYKVALAVFCLLVPLVMYLVARFAGLCRGVSVLACFLGLLVWWGQPGRAALEAGDVDLLLATLMVLAQAGLLVRYHRAPGALPLIGVMFTGLVAWFAHPLFSLLVLPLFLLYYLTVGPKHRLFWHVPLFLGLVAAVLANSFWLQDWVEHWWIRVPPCRDASLMARRTLRAFWEAPLWGCAVDRALGCLLVVAGLIGVILLERSGRRACGRFLGAGAVGLLVLAFAGVGWEPFARLGASQLLVPALLFTVPPAALAIGHFLDRQRHRLVRVVAPAAVLGGVPVLLGLAFAGQKGTLTISTSGPLREWGLRIVQPRPLTIGMDEAQTALIEAVRRQTTDSARILWEDRRGPHTQSRWTALLPLLTGRAFVGGLDVDAGIEHTTSGLVSGQLAGRPLEEWTDAELEAYCRRYNIGWIVCGSPASRKRFGRWQGATTGTTLPAIGTDQPHLFVLRRKPTYILAGSARWLEADARGILLSDAVGQQVPGEEDGQIVLSLHYQEGMRVRPGRVRLERAVDSHDTIPFVRLRLREPVGRILITWDGE